jgi:hypothetical protein
MFKSVRIILDVLVVLVISPALFLGFYESFRHAQVVVWLQEHPKYINRAGLLTCVVLLVWIVFRGAESALWKWFPPFCFIPAPRTWQKWLVVMALIIGTLIGSIFG